MDKPLSQVLEMRPYYFGMFFLVPRIRKVGVRNKLALSLGFRYSIMGGFGGGGGGGVIDGGV